MNSDTYVSLPDDTKRALGSHFAIDETVPTGEIEIRRPNKQPFRVSAAKLARHLRKAEARRNDLGYLLGEQKRAE